MSKYSTIEGHPIETVVLVDSAGSLTTADDTDGQAAVFVKARNYVWDAIGLTWVRETQPGGGGGGGGAVTVADGADVAQGATTDVKVLGDTAGTLSAKLRGINTALAGTLTTDVTDRTARLLGHVTVDNASIAVTGTFWQATQPISGNVGLLAGAAVIGHVIVDSGAITASGTVTANQGGAPWSENITQFGGAAVATGTGAGGVGIPRVTVSNDSTVGLVAGSAVIGHVIVDTAPSTAVTNAGLTNIDVLLSSRTKPADQQHTILDSGTLTSITNALPSGTNVIGHVIADTGSTTAVTGNVTVVQPTALNLNATVSGPTVENASPATVLSPVPIAGQDNTSIVRSILTDAQGTIFVMHRFELFEEILNELKRHSLALSIISGDDITEYEY